MQIQVFDSITVLASAAAQTAAQILETSIAQM
jgi:hypothetical protein